MEGEKKIKNDAQLFFSSFQALFIYYERLRFKMRRGRKVDGELLEREDKPRGLKV